MEATNATGTFTPILWFFAVIAAIPLALWLFKRSALGGGSAGHSLMRSVAVLPLSPSQRVVTVEVGHGDERRWLVLGVTPSSITTLHNMRAPAPSEDTANTTPPGTVGEGFAALLARTRRAP